MINSINDLPVEQLIDIMRCLDQEALKEAILTCQRWKEVIENHCLWSVILRNVCFSYFTVRDLHKTKRKLRITLHITNEYVYGVYIFKQIGCGVTYLTWDFGKLNDTSLFCKCLKYLPNVEDMIVDNLDSPAVRDDCDVHDLKKLKTLEVIRCYDSIYKCFRTSNIKSLAISEMSITSQCVVNFIRRQKSLTKLNLYRVDDCGTLFQQLCDVTPNGTLPFKLAHLIVEFYDGLLYDIVELGKFIKMQSETLRELDLCANFHYSVYKIVFGELKSLKFLRLKFLIDIEFGESLKENISIEDLTLSKMKLSPLALSQFCKRLPNIRKLSLYGKYQTEQLQIVSTALNNVTTLFVYKFNRNFEAIKFSNLTTIHICFLLCNVDWTAFCKANSGITEIVIKRVDCLTLNHIEMITRHLKLQILKIGEGFSTDERFRSIIHNNCPELKVLELHKSCGIEDLDWTDERAYLLRFSYDIEIGINQPMETWEWLEL